VASLNRYLCLFSAHFASLCTLQKDPTGLYMSTTVAHKWTRTYAQVNLLSNLDLENNLMRPKIGEIIYRDLFIRKCTLHIGTVKRILTDQN
jgi:hypothetical protein